MSVFYNSRRSMLVIKCDGCGFVADVCKNQTDRLIANEWVHENNWRTMKIQGKWAHLCPECSKAYYSKKRDAFVANL